MNKYEHPTINLATTFHNPEREANMYINFEYIPQTICNHTQRQSSRLINADSINAKNRLTINDAKVKTKNPKRNTSKWNVLRKLTFESNVLNNALNFNHVTIITEEF